MTIHIPIRHDSDIVIARRHTRAIAAQQGFDTPAIEALATAVTEIAQNIVIHASLGELVLAPVTEVGRRGVVATLRDHGPGIADIARAMQDGFSTGGGLGLGLPSAKRLVDELEIESVVGTGTTITLRKWR